MKGCLKFFGFMVIIVLIIFGILVFYGTRGLSEGQNLEIGNVSFESLEDGEYNGKYSFGRWSNEVKVTVFEGRVTSIKLVKDLLFVDDDLREKVYENVILNQNLEVDVVSGATISTKAYLKAIENAVK